MGVRSTSRRAYVEVQESGITTVQRDKIMKYLYAGETPKTLREIQGFTLIDINAVSGRCNELKKAGTLFEHTKRKCTVTGRMVTPVHPEKLFGEGGQGALFTGSETKPRYRHPHYDYEQYKAARKR